MPSSDGGRDEGPGASAQVAVYPLRQERLSPAVAAVQAALSRSDLQIEPGPMSTLVLGTAPAIFAALGQAFAAAASRGPVVMTVTISNACPVPD